MSQPSEVTYITVDLNNLEDAFADPRFKAMINDGWRVRASLPINRMGKEEWLLLLEKHLSTTHPVSLNVASERKIVAVAVVIGIVSLAQIALASVMAFG